MSESTTAPTPAQAWEAMAAGNARFAGDALEQPNRDALRRSVLVGSQHPIAAVLSCSDSRVPAEIIFDQGLGDLFMVRTAGQALSDTVLGSLEFSVNVLEVPLLVVLGHDSCGAVTAAKQAVDEGTLPGGYIRSLVEQLTPAVLQARAHGASTVDEMVGRNVTMIADRILEQSPSIAAAVSEGRLAVVGSVYHLSDGTVDVVGEPRGL